MPSVFSTTAPIGGLLAPARQSRDWASFDRDTTPRPCCRPPPSNKAPSNKAPKRFALPNLGSPLGKRSSNHGSPLGNRCSSPMKSKLRGMPASTRMRLSCLEHSAMCMLEKDSVGPGGLPSKAVGPITRTKALTCANRKIEKMAQQQRWLQHLMSVEEACAASSAEPHAAEPTARTTIPAASWHFTRDGAAAAAATRSVEAAKAAAATAEAEAATRAAAEAESAKAEPPAEVKAVVTRPHYLEIRAQTRPSQPWHLPDPAAATAAATSKRAIPVPPSAPAASRTPRAQSAHIRARVGEMCIDGMPSPDGMPSQSAPKFRPMTTPARESPTMGL